MSFYDAPTSLDLPRKAFMWDFDVFIIAVTGIIVGLVTRQVFIFLPLFLFFAIRWGKFKSGKHPWFFIHAFFWYLPIPEKNLRIPQTHQREFLK